MYQFRKGQQVKYQAEDTVRVGTVLGLRKLSIDLEPKYLVANKSRTNVKVHTQSELILLNRLHT